MRFCALMRPVIKQVDPDISFVDMGRKLGKLWRSLSDKEKEEYC